MLFDGSLYAGYNETITGRSVSVMQEVTGHELYEMAQYKCSGHGGQCSGVYLFGAQTGIIGENNAGN